MTRTVLTVIGAFMLGLGLFWVGQGTGVIMWPAQSFMLAQVQWAYIGGVLAIVGAILMWVARR
jgi:hypothetical protein